MSDTNNILSLRGISHQYSVGGRQIEVLSDVDLDVADGEIVEIQGQSGSGKTTLLLAGGGMQKPTAGQVSVGGQDLFRMTTSNRIAYRSRNIGYLFQTLQLLPYLTVFQNLILGPGVLSREAKSLLEQFGLSERMHHKPGSLSHGQRQRTALIRAMVHQPKLIIADEPTGNLDEENARIVFQSLRRFADAGNAVLIASHDPILSDFSDRRYQLEEKKLLKEGSGPGI